MRTASSIIPEGGTYLVLEDFGRFGRGWRETDEECTDRSTLIRDLMSGECTNPIRIVAFTAQGWSRDVTVEIADELRRRFLEYDTRPTSIERGRHLHLLHCIHIFYYAVAPPPSPPFLGAFPP